ncbi:MAG: chromate transporter [Armatimonadetes bacterium]|nr:chromate transporter [Armatimonadota bacterium]
MDTTPPTERRAAQVTPLAIFLAFAKVSVVSVGGGTTVWVREVVVRERKWMTNEEFLEGRGLCQFLPGANNLNFAVYAGSRFCGPIGALAAILGLTTLPFILVVGLTMAYLHSGKVHTVDRLLAGMGAAAVGATFGAGIDMSKDRLKDPLFCLLAAGVIVAVGAYRVNMLTVALLAVLAGTALYVLKSRRS